MTEKPVERRFKWRLAGMKDGRPIWVRVEVPEVVKVKVWMSAQDFLERLRMVELEEESRVRASREFQKLMEMPYGWSGR